VEWPGNRNNEIGLGDVPTLDEGRCGRQIGRVPLGTAVLHPLDDPLLLTRAEARVVGKSAMLGTGMPGWHPSLLHHLADRLPPAPCVFVARQGKRCDLAPTVADDAVLIEDRGDVLAIGNASRRSRPVQPVDDAARWRRYRTADFLAGEQFRDGLRQVAP